MEWENASLRVDGAALEWKNGGEPPSSAISRSLLSEKKQIRIPRVKGEKISKTRTRKHAKPADTSNENSLVGQEEQMDVSQGAPEELQAKTRKSTRKQKERKPKEKTARLSQTREPETALYSSSSTQTEQSGPSGRATTTDAATEIDSQKKTDEIETGGSRDTSAQDEEESLTTSWDSLRSLTSEITEHSGRSDVPEASEARERSAKTVASGISEISYSSQRSEVSGKSERSAVRGTSETSVRPDVPQRSEVSETSKGSRTSDKRTESSNRSELSDEAKPPDEQEHVDRELISTSAVQVRRCSPKWTPMKCSSANRRGGVCNDDHGEYECSSSRNNLNQMKQFNKGTQTPKNIINEMIHQHMHSPKRPLMFPGMDPSIHARFTRITLLFCMCFMFCFYAGYQKEMKFAVAKEFIPIRVQEMPCVEDENYWQGIERYPDCAPRVCGRFVADSLVKDFEKDYILELAEKITNKTGPYGGITLFDLITGAMSVNNTFIDFYDTPGWEKEFNRVYSAAFRLILGRIRRAIAERFHVKYHSLLNGRAMYFTKLNHIDPPTEREHYWRPHADKTIYTNSYYTAVVYLNTYGEDFFGGRLVFHNDGMLNKSVVAVEPRFGRVLVYTPGAENYHHIERVTHGNRYALVITFACDPDKAAGDPRWFSPPNPELDVYSWMTFDPKECGPFCGETPAWAYWPHK